MEAKKAHIDLGYRGHGYEGETEIRVVNYRTLKKKTCWAWKWMKRRAAIELIFGHIKSENQLNRNYLKGKECGKINALLSGCLPGWQSGGFNLRKLLKAFFYPFILLFIKQ